MAPKSSQSFGAKFKFNSINRFKGSVSHVLIVVLDPGDRKNIRQRKQLPLLPLPAVCLCSERTQHTHVQAGPLCVCAGKSTTKEKQENYERNTKKENKIKSNRLYLQRDLEGRQQRRLAAGLGRETAGGQVCVLLRNSWSPSTVVTRLLYGRSVFEYFWCVCLAFCWRFGSRLT